MADWIKIGIKAGLVASVTALLLFILGWVTFPDFDISIFTQGIAFAKAIGEYYFPAFSVLAGIFVSLLGIQVVLLGVQLSLVAIRWIFKVNE